MSTAENMRTGAMERVRVPKTAEVVAQAIRTRIVRGEIAEDDALPSEAELMAQFGVSRPSLREAFRILESEQLITVRRGSHGGARARHPDITVASRYLGLLMQVDGVLLSDVFHARALIEPIALRLLAQRDDRVGATERLLAMYDKLGKLTDPRDRAEGWTEFFLTLFDLAGNKTLRLLYGTLTEVVRQEIVEWSRHDTAENTEATAKAVAKAMRLVAAGEGDKAADFWRGQMFLVEQRVAQTHRGRTVVDAVTSG
ncbi:FadR/GntR family transcriptional regulator [Pseudonocardia kunmingensis]|uniref:GntR family transcriptional regulator n=1 Tax=Pseudonocardia kunmingensis TaxID=630975 RepID=A0A543DPB9_9PSEU|nr:GntR family transcriptional regulator [Pseudonocardia kunmingensis]TQM11184.1 GntR family transcriptional regulator [Pseudonocardia kunmingensis]